MLRLTVFIAALLVSPFTRAQEISYIDQSDEHLIFGLDDSISRKGATVSGWTEWKQFVDPNSETLGTVTKKLYIANCSDRVVAVRAATEYEDPSLSKVTKMFQVKRGEEEFNDAVPGSVGESIMKWLCKPAAKKTQSKKASSS